MGPLEGHSPRSLHRTLVPLHALVFVLAPGAELPLEPAGLPALLNLQGRCLDAAALVPDAAALALRSKRKSLPLRTLAAGPVESSSGW
jgi:hypothetical protein